MKQYFKQNWYMFIGIFLFNVLLTGMADISITDWTWWIIMLISFIPLNIAQAMLEEG